MVRLTDEQTHKIWVNTFGGSVNKMQEVRDAQLRAVVEDLRNLVELLDNDPGPATCRIIGFLNGLIDNYEAELEEAPDDNG